MCWRKAQIESRASTVVETRHVMLKPSLGLRRSRVMGLASQYGDSILQVIIVTSTQSPSIGLDV